MHFSIQMSGFQFLRNVLLVSMAGLVPPLVVFVFLTPGFAAALGQGGPAFMRFMRQVLTNGLPVVFAINYVTFFLYALSKEKSQGTDPVTFVVVDVFARLTLFFALHAVIYVLSADWYGSFGGSRLTAASVVAPTLARSAFFENISGVYFYATMVSAIPFYISVSGRSKALRKRFGLLPLNAGAIAFAVGLFAATAVFLTLLAQAIVHIQS